MLPTIEDLQKMRETDIREIDESTLKDISEIQIDKKKAPDIRVREYLEQVQNPYFVKVGDYVLQFAYADSGRDINDCLLEYVSGLTKIEC